jgi:teichoic acid transport system permease protein
VSTATRTASGADVRPQDEFTSDFHVYEPHRIGLPPLRPYLRELWRRRQFAREMARTNLRALHFDTALGQLWLILHPLLLTLVYFLLVDILRHGTRGPTFFAHLMAGLFAFHFFSQAVIQGAKSVVGGGRLILNTAFPRTLLPISSVITAFMRFLPTLGVYAVVQVYFRDLSNFLPYLMRIWLYGSPVLYYYVEVPHRFHWIIDANPLTPMLASWSDVLNRGLSPSLSMMAWSLAWAVGALVVGGAFFISREREFAVRL